jgi:hypothetical protein
MSKTLSNMQKEIAKSWKISCIKNGSLAMKKFNLDQAYADYKMTQKYNENYAKIRLEALTN